MWVIVMMKTSTWSLRAEDDSEEEKASLVFFQLSIDSNEAKKKGCDSSYIVDSFPSFPYYTKEQVDGTVTMYGCFQK